MRRWGYVSLVVMLVFILGCATSNPSLSMYMDDMYNGRKALVDGNYERALDLFLTADRHQPSAAALAFAGVASYRMGDIQGADKHLSRAQEISGGSDAVWVILGYRSLVFMKEGRGLDGWQSLKAFTELYKGLEPQSKDLAVIEQMLDSDNIDVPYVETFLDKQVRERYVDYNKL